MLLPVSALKRKKRKKRKKRRGGVREKTEIDDGQSSCCQRGGQGEGERNPLFTQFLALWGEERGGEGKEGFF